MAKFVVVALVVGLVLWLMFGRRGRRVPPAATPKRRGPEDMLTCAHCGVHLPRSEALVAGGRAYCSAAHRDAGPRVDG
ncbi:PP0621 family protein [Azohydromonas sediminis]|uniref:PP0621 family protein n=1 Tax=Azohydromonas sediminis TaxID=2259674 RepID=UPI000E65D3BC|nr:PP0621 family protein [Azohydromonas sediminis]